MDQKRRPGLTTPGPSPEASGFATTDETDVSGLADTLELTDRRRVAALHVIAQRTRAETVQRRQRVLRHRDLAERLTQPPLNYKRPDQWGGYVPPALLAEDADCIISCGRPTICLHEHGAARDTSPRRAALVEIAAEAWRREHEQVAS